MFGLYVGNSSACISMLKDGEVQVLVNDIGSRVTAASVEILDNERVVGVTAKAGPNNGGNVIFQSKMYLSPERASENKIEGYCSVVAKEDGSYEYMIDTGSKKVGVTPKQVAVEIFHYLYKIASSASHGLNNISAILTVPQNFSQEAKDDFCDAAITGGFKILQVITDTAAAILAYDCLAIEEATRKILVYRAGGTSIDVSVACVVNGMLQVVKSKFEPGPCGNAITAAIFDYIARDVEMRMHFNPLENVRCRLKLYKLAEHCKHILSTNSSTTCCLETFYNGMDYSQTITRSRMENLISSILNQLTKPVNSLLEELGMKPDDFDKVILCGGSLKIPKLQKYFKDRFPNSEVLISIPPDEVLAVGAAMQGNYLLDSTFNIFSKLQEDVPCLEESIFIKVKGDDNIECLLPKNTFLPTTALKNLSFQTNGHEPTLEILSCKGAHSDVIKQQVAIPKAEETKVVSLELSIDGEGVMETKIARCEKEDL